MRCWLTMCVIERGNRTMKADTMKAEPSLTEADVARVYDVLAQEHADKLQLTEGRRTYQRIQRLLNRPSRERLPAGKVAWLTLAPALGAAALTLAVTSWLTPGPLAFEVEGAVNQDGLVQTGSKPAVLTFSDESRIVAKPNTALNMSLVGEHGALARVREGELSVKVEHADTTDWRFLAGPFEVRVVGTQFELEWEPERSELSVVMREGRVRVIGPQKSETIMSAGESRTFKEAPPKAALAPVAGALPAREVARAEDAPAEEDTPAAPHLAAKAAARAKAPSWARLVGKGRFGDVVEQAESMGIASALSSRSSQDLEALAQAAQYTGRMALALKTWSAVRQRFGSQTSGRQAAFFMGRIYDQQGKGQSALSWLDTYLMEAGSGVYASEALGRKLTLVQRLQGEAEARKVAREYLRRFPKGAYATTASALLSE